MKPYWLVIVLAGVLCAGGCKSAQPSSNSDKEKEAGKITDEELQKIVAKAGTTVPPTEEIGVSAYLEGKRIHVGVKNQSQQTIIVGPKNLGILTSDGKIIRFQPHEGGFPVTKLLPGDRIEGLLPLRGLQAGGLAGMQLVFKHPQTKEVRTAIEGGPQTPVKKAAPAAAPTKP